MPRILMVGSEAAPFAKTGGLADVLGSLPASLVAQGEEVAVVLPRYRRISLQGMRKVYSAMPLWVGPGIYRADIYLSIERGALFFFVDLPPLYDREGLYGERGHDYGDNPLRFAALCHAAIGVARHLFRPQVFHLHDWQAGLLPVFLQQFFAGDPTFYGIRTLFTIHNLGYQGEFDRGQLYEIGLPLDVYRPDRLEFYGNINLMKGGLVYSDHLSTVSPTYAEEIQTPEHGFRLDGLLRERSGVLTGILNGVDYDEWNPETDAHLVAHYSADDLSGKAACRRDLLEEFGMSAEPEDAPVIGIVSRLVAQKGFDLIAAIANELQDLHMRMIVLGTGESQYEDLFRHLAWARPDRFAVRIAYDNRIAHKIEAGADMFLMPSRYEPCGLNQIYSLRYGAVPVVRATGGLDDTIDESTGFKFRAYSPEALLSAIRSALMAYRDRGAWENRMREGMRRDFSWRHQAGEYSALYRRLIAG